MGYKFSLVLNREVTEQETVKLKEIACGNAAFGIDSLPTDSSVPVTRIDFDDTVSPTLAEAIEAGMEAVKQMPDLGIPGLSVPAQPAGPVAQDPDASGAAVEAGQAGEPAKAGKKTKSKAAS